MNNPHITTVLQIQPFLLFLGDSWGFRPPRSRVSPLPVPYDADGSHPLLEKLEAASSSGADFHPIWNMFEGHDWNSEAKSWRSFKQFRNKMMTWTSFRNKHYDRNDLGRIGFKTFRFNMMIEDVRCEQKLHELFVNFVAMVFFHGLHCRQCCKTFTFLRPLATATPTAFCALHGRGLHDMAKIRSIFSPIFQLMVEMSIFPKDKVHFSVNFFQILSWWCLKLMWPKQSSQGRKLLMVDALLKEPDSYWKRQVSKMRMAVLAVFQSRQFRLQCRRMKQLKTTVLDRRVIYLFLPYIPMINF